jgi:hypothetical protein
VSCGLPLTRERWEGNGDTVAAVMTGSFGVKLMPPNFAFLQCGHAIRSTLYVLNELTGAWAILMLHWPYREIETFRQSYGPIWVSARWTGASESAVTPSDRRRTRLPETSGRLFRLGVQALLNAGRERAGLCSARE